jgi:outer membrane biosynthesis protein TonB
MSIRLTEEGQRMTLTIATQTKSAAGDQVELDSTTTQESPGSEITTKSTITLTGTPLMQWTTIYSPAKESAELQLSLGKWIDGISQVLLSFDLMKPNMAVCTGTMDGKALVPFTVTDDGQGNRTGPKSIEFTDGTQPSASLDSSAVEALMALNSAVEADYKDFSSQETPIPEGRAACWGCLTLCSIAILGCVAACPATGPGV